ncbi:MAG: HNH endonuclease [Janthinobacterium lividum]
MIRVVKSSSPPAPLPTRGVRDRARLVDLEEQDPAACQAPDNTILTPKDGIYNDPRVKRQVCADQHDKCCYCESKPSDNYGDVEHYRPKGGVQQNRSDDLEKPGYYWLAHEWSNLYFACIFCNQKYKGNYFPLRHAAARARSHADVLTLEQPWLLDPATEDPAPHLTFVKDAIKPLTDRGRYTVEICGLDRPELIQRRIQHLRALCFLKWVSELDMSLPLNAESAGFMRKFKLSLAEAKKQVALARVELPTFALDSAEFASMVRTHPNFQHLPTV